MATCSLQYFDSALAYIKKQSGGASIEAMMPIEQIHVNKPPTRIEFSHYNALLATGAKLTKQPLLGFYLGQDIKSADYGELGYLAETCQKLAQAINALLEYESIVADFAKSTLNISCSHAEIIWTPLQPCNKHVTLRNITAWITITRLMVACPLKLDALFLTDSYSLSEQKTLAQWFGCPITTSAKQTKFIFPKTYLSLKLVTANKNINQIFSQVSQQSLTQLLTEQTLTQHITYMLKASHDLSLMTQEQVATQLHLSTRTLQRKLRKEHSNFFTLFDLERKHRVISHIGQMPMNQLSLLCGFSDQSALNKAFKRWFNCSPTTYLKAQK